MVMLSAMATIGCAPIAPAPHVEATDSPALHTLALDTLKGEVAQLTREVVDLQTTLFGCLLGIEDAAAGTAPHRMKCLKPAS